jgi:single-strand DNA-binding protein
MNNLARLKKTKMIPQAKNKNKMNNLRNKVQLIGNLGQNPEVKEFNGGKKFAKFSLATNESYRNKAGEKVTDTQWHNLIAWGKTAEIVEKYVKKGSEIAVEGKLLNRNYTDKDGVKRYVTEIQVSDLVMLGGKKD